MVSNGTCDTRWHVGLKRPGPGHVRWTVVSACTEREAHEKLRARGDLTSRYRVYAGPIKLKHGEKPYITGKK